MEVDGEGMGEIDEREVSYLIKTIYTARQDIRRFRVNGETITYLILQKLLKQLYDPGRDSVPDYCIQVRLCQENITSKYVDDEFDFVTIGNEAELVEAFRIFSSKESLTSPLHLIVSGNTFLYQDDWVGKNSDLVAISDLFLEKFSALSLSDKDSKEHKSLTDSVEELTGRLAGIKLKG